MHISYDSKFPSSELRKDNAKSVSHMPISMRVYIMCICAGWMAWWMVFSVWCMVNVMDRLLKILLIFYGFFLSSFFFASLFAARYVQCVCVCLCAEYCFLYDDKYPLVWCVNVCLVAPFIFLLYFLPLCYHILTGMFLSSVSCLSGIFFVLYLV